MEAEYLKSFTIAYYKRRWVFVPLFYIPKDAYDEATGELYRMRVTLMEGQEPLKPLKRRDSRRIKEEIGQIQKSQVPAVIRSAWEQALKKAEIDDFRFHDLRHCAASYLAMSGASLSEIAEILGHKTLAMVKRYAHLSDTHKHAVIDRMNKTFLEME